MAPTDLINTAKSLPVADRLDLIDELIESVEQDAGVLSPESEKELERRYQAYLANPTDGQPWEVMRERIQRSLDEARARSQNSSEPPFQIFR